MENFIPKNSEYKVFQWLMFQMGNIGPILGQHHHFHHFNPGKSEYSEERFLKQSVQIYKTLDDISFKNQNF